jgi:ADP-ribosylglycohydrolase
MINNYARKSLDGLWVGDCIGNLGTLYFCHDILKALETGMAKFGGQLDKFQKQFQYSDDTEEAIVLYNHLLTNKGNINQDALAMEFATRYMDRDPDGEIYGYGLNTRKVLRDIYDGIPWNEANKIFVKSEGMPSHIDSLVNSLSQGKGYADAMKDVNDTLRKQVEERASTNRVKQGSCGNGSAMRIAPLGAFLGQEVDENGVCKNSPERVIELATLSAEPTHCHAEGIAGAIATALASYYLVSMPMFTDTIDNWDDDIMKGYTKDHIGKLYLKYIIKHTPEGEVKNGLVKALDLSYDVPMPEVIKILGNGTHVTCQDTVPLCCYMVSKALCRFPKADMYEKVIIETSTAFGDVDTNCAIVGGIISTIAPTPEKWIKFCQPMEGVL